MRLGLPPRPRGSRCVRVVCVFLLAGLLLATGTPSSCVWAAGSSQQRETGTGRVQAFKSPHFLVRTDLSADDAREQLKQLESMLKLISNYWGRPPAGLIECFVVHDLANWSPQQQKAMEGPGLDSIRKGLGVSIGTGRSNGKRMLFQAKVYGVARQGVVLHESVHAYCQQTFGNTGPLWYAEGMAELGHYWVEGNRGVNAPQVVINYLRNNPRRKLEAIVVNKKTLGGSGEDYAWWWSLCHLLENNPNYRAQFRALGRDILAGKETTFRDVFGKRLRQIEFELDFFLDHLERDYRVDLCCWDWKRDFNGEGTSAVVRANRGWQPSGLRLRAGREYRYSASGFWRFGKDGESLSADGAADGQGRLVGVLLKDYKLGEEFELGRSGTFRAPSDGDLYLRCRAPWTKIADNADRVLVKIRGDGIDHSIARQ